MFSKKVKYILPLLISMMVIIMMFQPAYAAVTHEAFTIVSPAENEIYPVNEKLQVFVKCEKFVVEYANGFRVSDMNYVILEISKDDVVKHTVKATFAAYDVGTTREYMPYTPTETGIYTVRVGFCQYDRGEKLIETGNDEVTDVNYVGSYQFTVSEVKPELVEEKKDDTTETPASTDKSGETPATNSSSSEKNDTTTETKTPATKKANTMTVKAKKVTVSLNTLKKKNVTIKAKNAFTVKKAIGKVTYKKTSGSSKITVSKAGKITVKKKTKKGKYTIKVKVTAAGNNSYKAKSKTVKLTITVK